MRQTSSHVLMSNDCPSVHSSNLVTTRPATAVAASTLTRTAVTVRCGNSGGLEPEYDTLLYRKMKAIAKYAVMGALVGMAIGVRVSAEPRVALTVRVVQHVGHSRTRVARRPPRDRRDLSRYRSGSDRPALRATGVAAGPSRPVRRVLEAAGNGRADHRRARRQPNPPP